MTLTAIDATISGDRHNIDIPAYLKDASIIKASKEFQLISRRAALVMLNSINNVEDVLGYAEAMMVMAYRLGYNTKAQEIGAGELETFFTKGKK